MTNGSVATNPASAEPEPFFDDLLERLSTMHDGIEQALDGLPPEALDWTPGPNMNSIAVLVVHLTAAERYWIGDVACGLPSGRDRDAEFAVKGIDAADLPARVHEATAFARRALANLTLDDLAQERLSARNERTFTAGWALLHALEHTAVHTGHIQIQRQLWDQKRG